MSQEPDTRTEGELYQYQPLTRLNVVRILQLYPGEVNDPIFCALHTVEIDSDPFYEAISYVWGDPLNKLDITCDSRRLAITVNLYGILMRLCHQTKSRALWADAICIN